MMVEEAVLRKLISALSESALIDLSTAWRPRKPEADGVTLRCPDCESVLEPATLLGVAVDRCRKDRQFWLDFGELQKLLTAANGAALFCPGCGDPMRPSAPIEKSLASCDACKSHWLNKAQLAALTETPPERLQARWFSTLECPVCRKKLASDLVENSGVLVCRDHGAWVPKRR